MVSPIRMVALAVCAAPVALAAWLAIDSQQRASVERKHFQRWVAESCMPVAEGHRVVVRLDGGRMRCTIFSGGGYGNPPAEPVATSTLEVPK